MSTQKSPKPKTEPTEKPRNNNNWAKYFPNRCTDWLLVLFTALLALFTYFLWDSTDKLWKSGKQQIAIARDAADAAKKSAEVATKTLLITHRPWCAFSDNIEIIKPVNVTADRVMFSIRAILRNGGTAPALKTRIVITPSISPPNINFQGNFPIKPFSEDTNVFGKIILPGDTIPSKYDISTIIMDMPQIQNTKINVYLTLNVIYKDEFDEDHFSQQNWKYIGDKESPYFPIKEIKGYWMPIGTGNIAK
jgi:hypothetical protein